MSIVTDAFRNLQRLGRRARASDSARSQSAHGARARLRRLFSESLEPRWLLSVSAAEAAVVHSNLVLEAATGGSVQGLSPQLARHAYGFDQIAFSSTPGDGRGQTIAIVDPYDDPNIAGDLTVFDQQFGIAAPPSFTKVYASGVVPRVDAGWSQEISLDVEWAHAMAPGANIVLVEARSANVDDLLSAVNVAREMAGVSVVSMSWGGDEFSDETADDTDFTTPGGHQSVAFVAASGDQGGSTVWPSISPNVLAVGGTTLFLADGNYSGETAWSDSGGGPSQFEGEPSYQASVQSTGARTVPDVAYDANPNTGFAVYDQFSGGWIEVGGTSAGTPQWAALIAIADQGRAAAGEGSLSDPQALVYQLPRSDFHDIVSGSNGFAATPGYDLTTGLGSPVANLVAAGLVSASSGLTAGGLPVNLGSVAESLTHSAEYYSDFVTHAYATFLGRSPDAGGLAWWTQQMQQGMSDEQLEAALISSTEYFALHGGTDPAWLDATYNNLLNRPADASGAAYWLGQLQLGVSRDQVALDIATSAEREAMVVSNDYLTFLGRGASSAEIAYWVAQFGQGAHNEDIVAGFVGSAEYYNDVNKGDGTPSGWITSAYQDLFQRAPMQAELNYWLGQL